MRNILIALFTLLSFSLSAQIIRTVGIVYTGSLPTHVPSAQGAWVAIDTLTGQWYERDNTAGIWREVGARLQATNTTGVPSYTPQKQRGRLAINSGDSLYYYQAGTWTHINAGGGGGGTDDQTLSIDSVTVTGGRRFTISIEDGNSVSFIDSIGSGGVNTDSTTVLFQDSILIYYTLNGVEYDRDTIRIAGGGGGGVSGSGTTNYVSKWTGATSQGNSQIFDNGTDVGIRNTAPVSGLHLSKTLAVNTGEFMTVSDVTSGNSVKMGVYYSSGFNRYPGIWLNQTTANTTNYAFLFDPDADRTLFNAPAGGLITFRLGNNAGTSAMTLGPTGKLFIGGQNNPFSTLEVRSKGTTSSTGAFAVKNSSNSNLIYMSDAGDFTIFNEARLGSPTGPLIKSGSGTPEGVVTAPVGSMFLRTNGGAGTTLYVKESGTGNVGWIGK